MPTIPPKFPLVSYLKVESGFTAELKKTLEAAAKQVEADILKLGTAGNPLTQAQMQAQRAAIKAQLAQSFTGDIQDIIARGQQAAVMDAVNVIGAYEKQLLSALGNANYIDDIIRAEAARSAAGVNTLLARYQSSYIPLSQQVYRTGLVANKAVDKAIDVALVRGLSARDFAKSMRSLVSPSTPGGVSYAAMRTARTEINNAHHAATQQRYEDSKIVEAVNWHLSGSHPEGDECDMLVNDSPYKTGAVPSKPHPQCLCYTTPALPSREEFLERMKRGDYGDEPWAGEARQRVAPRSDTLEMQRQKAWDKYLVEQKQATARLQSLRAQGLEPLKDAEYMRLFSQYDASLSAYKKLASQIAKQARISSAAIQPRIAKLAQGAAPANGLTGSIRGANPKGRGWYGPSAASVDFQINCTRVAATVEMRARGFKVQAAGTPRTQAMDRTKNDANIKKNWVDPKTGSPRALRSAADEAKLMAAMEKAPDGARYFVVSPWKNGGAHIWNAEKIDGKVYFFEGQAMTEGSPAQLTRQYLDRMKFGGKGAYGVRWMRVDDLIPTDSMVTRKWVLPE